MFENLNQNKEQDQSGGSFSSRPGAGNNFSAPPGNTQPPAAQKVEDMFADVKDVAVARDTAEGTAKGAPGSKGGESSNKIIRVLVVIIIVLVIVMLGLFLASRFLGKTSLGGVEGSGAWISQLNLAEKFSSLKNLLGKKQPAVVIVENNETKGAPESTPREEIQPTQTPPTNIEQPAVVEQPLENPAAPIIPPGATTTAPISETATSTPALEEKISTSTLAQMDSDQDGLNDYEEIYIYHTDPDKADTDGDTYLDGEEVKNGYNPNGSGKLIQ